MQPSQVLACTPLHGLQEQYFKDVVLPLVSNGGFKLNNGLCHKASEALGTTPGVLKQLQALLIMDMHVHAPERSHPGWLPATRGGPVPCPAGGWGCHTKYKGAFDFVLAAPAGAELVTRA